MELKVRKPLDLFALSMSESEYKKSLEKLYLPVVTETLDRYIKVLNLYEKGEITKSMRDRETERLYNQSSYDNLFDFLYDLERRKCGLPIYIKIDLLKEVEL